MKPDYVQRTYKQDSKTLNRNIMVKNGINLRNQSKKLVVNYYMKNTVIFQNH